MEEMVGLHFDHSPDRDVREQQSNMTVMGNERQQIQLDAGGNGAATNPTPEETLTRSLIELGGYVGLTAARITGAALGAVARRLAQTSPVRVVSQVTLDTLAVAREEFGVDWSQATRLAEQRLARVVAVVLPVVVQSVDQGDLIKRLDLEAMLDEVDVNALLSHVDMNRLLGDLDIAQLMSRVDIGSMMERIDLNDLLAEVDLDALLDRVDVEAIVRRVRVGDRVVEGTEQIAESAIDLARRQGVGLDVLLARAVNRILGRDSNAMPPGPRALTEAQSEPPS